MNIINLKWGVAMKRKISIAAILVLGISLISCAAQMPIPDTARVVQLTVPSCD
jgi:hypothetical protein